jgi:drug/metabolite transporter (DMT)-like permease
MQVFALLIARRVGWESSGSWRQSVGELLAISGALFVTVVAYKGEASAEGALDTLLGNFLLLTWVLGAAAGIVCQRPLLKHHSPLCLTAYVNGVAAVVIVVFTPFEAHTAADWDLSGWAWASAAYSASSNLVHG